MAAPKETITAMVVSTRRVFMALPFFQRCSQGCDSGSDFNPGVPTSVWLIQPSNTSCSCKVSSLPCGPWLAGWEMRTFFPRVQGLTKSRPHTLSLGKLIRLAFAGGAALCLGLAPAHPESLNDVQIRKLQEALIWTTDYEGLVDGKSGPGTLEAISKFQARIGNPVTGQLSPAEFIKLIKLGTANRASVGFAQFTDNDDGVAVGVPLGLVSGPTTTKWGKHWYSKQAGLSIDTLRFNSEISLRELYTKLIGINNRKVAYQRLVENDWFVIAAFEGEAAVYVRANLVTPPDQPP